MTNSLNAPLARLIAGQICLHACMAGMRMAAPLLALQQGYSAAAVGVLLALFALTQVFLALPAGRFADRHGLRRPVRWSVGMAFSGAALAVAFPVYPVLCLSALMTGGAAGVAVIALQRHVGRAARQPDAAQAGVWLAVDRAGGVELHRAVCCRLADRPCGPERRLIARLPDRVCPDGRVVAGHLVLGASHPRAPCGRAEEPGPPGRACATCCASP
jgi:hypothetical protein